MARVILAACAAFALLCPDHPAMARPFTVDDLLHAESVGDVRIDPSGRWLVLEQRDPYDRAERYDYNSENSLAAGRLRVVDLRAPGVARPLLAVDPGPGVVMGPFSPTGRRLAIYRLHDRKWTLGVVALETGAVRWMPDVTPQEVGHGRTLQWLSDAEFLVIERTDGLPPFWMRLGWMTADRLSRAWEAAARGDGAHSVMGSGAYAAVRRRAPPNHLLRVDAASGRSVRLATGDLVDLELSPDRRRVALLSSGPDIQVRGDAPVRGPQGLETEARRLSILDLATGRQVTPCPTCDLLPQLLDWSPSGRAILALVRGPDGLWTSGPLVRIDPVSGAVAKIGDGLRLQTTLNPVTVWTSWMGDDPVVLARPLAAPAARDDWYRLGPGGPVNLTRRLPTPDNLVRVSDGGRFVVLAGDAVWAVDGRGGRARRIAAGAALVQRPPSSIAEARVERGPQPGFWLAVRRSAQRSLARLDVHGVRPLLPLADEDEPLVTASEAAKVAVTHETDPHGVERLWLRRPNRPAALVLTLNEDLADTDAPAVRPVRHSGPGGRTLVSWLFLPPPNPAGTAPPLIVRPYLGENFASAPRDPPGQLGFLQNIRVLTGHGYAVLTPSLPKPQPFLTEPADHLADRILAIVDAAVGDPALRGRFDPNRTALMGFSFGGYTVMTTITQTRRFRAAIAMDGISDLTAYWSSLGPSAQLNPEEGYVSNWHTGAVEATQPALLGPPWRQADRYVRNSPLFAADKIETPLLLIHGGQDSVPLAQSEAMYSALFRQGKDALMVTYWGALHGLTSPGDVRDVYARSFRFLDEHFADAVRRAPEPRGASPASGSASDGPSPPR